MIVENTIVPPGLHRFEQVSTSLAGSGTCSIASKQVTKSKDSFSSGRRSSASQFKYLISRPCFSACDVAVWIATSDISTPVILAPFRCRDSASNPPPQATSTALIPFTSIFLDM